MRSTKRDTTKSRIRSQECALSAASRTPTRRVRGRRTHIVVVSADVFNNPVGDASAFGRMQHDRL